MIDVIMPQMGESIVEGTLTRWLKKPGERVERDEPLFEISTDKVDTEIPSPVAGILADVLVEAGKTVAINTLVARINDGTSAPAPVVQPVAPPPAPAPVAPPPPPPPPTPVAAASAEPQGPLSPLVRKMARENNIDLGQVAGTGSGGRITKDDVQAHLSGAPVPASATTLTTTAVPVAQPAGLAHRPL